MAADRISINPFQPDDLEGVVGLLNQELHADPMSSETFQRKVLLDINFKPKGAPIAKAGDRMVGFMLGIVRSHPMEDARPDFDRGWITLAAVDKDFQRQGIGSRLWEHLKDYFKASGAKTAFIATYPPNYFWPGIDEAAYPRAIGFFKKHGFEVLHRPLSMDASLVHLKTPDWIKEKEAELLSEGVVFDTFKPKYILPLLDHLKAVSPGDWQRYIRESMVRITLGDFDRGRVYVAMQGDECVGFCQHDGERLGPFGVDDKERGRGIGAVLLLQCLHGMKAKGMHNAWFLSTTDQVAKLYAEGGFKETRRYAAMKCEL